MQQGLVLALAHCLSISSNADLQQQMIAEVLKGLAPACHHLQSLHQSKGAALTASSTSPTPQTIQLHRFSGGPTHLSREERDVVIPCQACGVSQHSTKHRCGMSRDR